MFPRLWAVAPLVAFALFSGVLAQEPDNRPYSNHSIFVNADGAIAFAFAIPEDNPDQFWFTLRVHRSHAWGAVGLGSEDMPGALYLMVYDNGEQKNTTFSPRVAYGYYEPAYYRDFHYELLEGTGIYDDHMVVMGKCLRNCFTWPAKGTDGGRIDINSAHEKGIYGLGPLEGFTSDNLDESLKYHVQYGSFYMDMTRAHGATRAPVLTDESRSEGAVLHDKFVRQADIMSTMHAVAMVLAIVLLMPLGVVMLRLGNLVRMHAINQTIALVLVFVGFGIGIATSYRYQRVGSTDTVSRRQEE
jgi:Cytochrome domain of cellobiose dehydrogenase